MIGAYGTASGVDDETLAERRGGRCFHRPCGPDSKNDRSKRVNVMNW